MQVEDTMAGRGSDRIWPSTRRIELAPFDEIPPAGDAARQRPPWLKLADLRERSTVYDSLPAPVSDLLQRSGLIALGILVVHLTLEARVTSFHTWMPKPAFFLFGWSFFLPVARFGGYALALVICDSVLLAVALGLLITTRGFSRARAAEMWAILIVVCAGVLAGVHFILIAIVPAMNLAVWVAMTVFILSFVFAVLSALLGGMTS